MILQCNATVMCNETRSFCPYNGQHVRIGEHSAPNSYSILVGKLVTLQALPQPVILHVVGKEGQRNIKENVVGVVGLNLGKK